MDIFDLSAKITLDSSQYEKGLESSKKGIENVGDKIKTGLANAAKIGAAAVGAASAAVGKLVKDSVEAYAEYEQLVGGVNTLFGTNGRTIEEYAKSVGKSTKEVEQKFREMEEAQETVLKNADNAYKTANMSANEYLQTSSLFAAGIIRDLGKDTKKAAELVDQTIIDMSDNANKLGTDIEMVRSAYSGMARGIFTALDNLRLGYKGSQKGMYELMTDAAKLDEQFAKTAKFSLNAKGQLVANYADMVQAIHIVQKDLGISGISYQEYSKLVESGAMTQAEAYKLLGTTAKEANFTIQGSVKQLKGAWTNLVAGLANPENDIKPLIDNVVESAKIAFKNIFPAVKAALSSISTVIKDIVPIITAELPGLVQQILPPLLEAAVSIVNGVVEALPALLQVVIEQVPTIINSIVSKALEMLPLILELALQLIEQLADGLVQSIPNLIPAVADVILQIVYHLTKPESLKMLISSALDLVVALVQGLMNALPTLIQAVFVLVDNIVQFISDPNNLAMVVNAALQITFAIIQGLIQALPELTSGVLQLLTSMISSLIEYLPNFLQAGITIVKTLAEGVVGNLGAIAKSALEVVNRFVKGIGDLARNIMKSGEEAIDKFVSGLGIKDAYQWGKDLIQNFINGIVNKFKDLRDTVKQTAATVKSYLGFSEPEKGPLSNFHTYAPDMMNLFIKGIKDNEGKLTAQIEKTFNFGEVGSISSNLGSSFTNSIVSRETNTGLTSILTNVLSGVGLYLDSGELVGHLAPKINQELGTLVSLQARGI